MAAEASETHGSKKCERKSSNLLAHAEESSQVVAHSSINLEGTHFDASKSKKKKHEKGLRKARAGTDVEYLGKPSAAQGFISAEYSPKSRKSHRKEYAEKQVEIYTNHRAKKKKHKNVEPDGHDGSYMDYSRKKKKKREKVNSLRPASVDDDTDVVYPGKKREKRKSAASAVISSVFEHDILPEGDGFKRSKSHKRKEKKHRNEYSFCTTVCDSEQSMKCVDADTASVSSTKSIEHSELLLASLPQHKKKKRCHKEKMVTSFATVDDEQLHSPTSFGCGTQKKKKRSSNDTFKDIEVGGLSGGFAIPNSCGDTVLFSHHVRDSETPKSHEIQKETIPSGHNCHSNKMSESYVSDTGLSELYSSCSYATDNERTVYDSDGFDVGCGSPGFDVDVVLLEHHNSPSPGKKNLYDQDVPQCLGTSLKSLSRRDSSSSFLSPVSGHHKHIGKKASIYEEKLTSLDLSGRCDDVNEQSHLEANLQESSSVTESVEQEQEKKHRKDIFGPSSARTSSQAVHPYTLEDAGPQELLSPHKVQKNKYHECGVSEPAVEFLSQVSAKDLICYSPKKHKNKKYISKEPSLWEMESPHQQNSNKLLSGKSAEVHLHHQESFSQGSDLIMEVLNQYFGQGPDSGNVPSEFPEQRQKKRLKDRKSEKLLAEEHSLHGRKYSESSPDDGINYKTSSQVREENQKKSPEQHHKSSRSKELHVEHPLQSPCHSEASMGDSVNCTILSQHHEQSPGESSKKFSRDGNRKVSSTERSPQAQGHSKSLMDDSDAPLFSDDDTSDQEHASSSAKKGQSTHLSPGAELSCSQDARSTSPVDRDFMEYVMRGEFPEIHKDTIEPAPDVTEAYEKTTGLTIRRHRFSLEEDQLLRQNFKNITKFFNLEHPYLILGHKGLESESQLKDAKKLAKEKKLLSLLGKGLPRRNLRMLYRRSRALFHPMRLDSSATFTPDESEQVLALYRRLGPKWHEMEKLMEKPADTIRIHFLQLEEKKHNIERGRWEFEEEVRLQNAMKKFGHTERNGRLPRGVTWEKIAKEVGTRGPAQCYKRWVYAFRRTEMTKAHKKVWNSFDTIHLINEIYHAKSIPSNDYDWSKVVHKFPAAKTARNLCRKWKYLVSNHVPKSSRNNEKACAAYLYKYHLPGLLSSCNISIERAVELSKCSRLKQ